jgi:hypothetical protein
MLLINYMKQSLSAEARSAFAKWFVNIKSIIITISISHDACLLGSARAKTKTALFDESEYQSSVQ